MSIMNDFYLKLWFSRGYYDGRAKGWEDINYDELTDYEKEAYGQGYDSGVTDYCLLDENNERL